MTRKGKKKNINQNLADDLTVSYAMPVFYSTVQTSHFPLIHAASLSANSLAALTGL